MKVIKWGIIGAGKISSQFARALTQMNGTKLVGVAARNIENAEDFAKQFEIPKWYGSYEELAKDEEIDVIYIGTPHTMHMEHSILCMKNGKSVLCEKPLALNQMQAEKMHRVAKENHVFFMEAMWTKFLPITRIVQEWIIAGEIGDVQNIQINFGFRSEFIRESRLYDLKLAGGALLDVGIYPITYATLIMGQMPESIVSSMVRGETGVDIQTFAILKYGSVLATLGSAISSDIGKEAIIIGTKGRIVVPDFWSATRASIIDKDGITVKEFHNPHLINGYEYEAYEVNACIRERKIESDVNPICSSIDIIKIMDSIRSEWNLVYPSENMQDDVSNL